MKDCVYLGDSGNKSNLGQLEMSLSMNYNLCLSLLFILCTGCLATRETPTYTVGSTSWINGDYSFIDSKGDTIRKLDKHAYTMSFTGTFEKFAVFKVKGIHGWCAIDIHENILFTVANFPVQEALSPDYLVEDRIRIIDTSGKYGFANKKGKIVIKPRFELVTHFNNGFAIILEDCHKVLWKDDDETDHGEHEGCNHYSLECNKYGYINQKGKIIKLGHYTFEEIQKEIGWEVE